MTAQLPEPRWMRALCDHAEKHGLRVLLFAKRRGRTQQHLGGELHLLRATQPRSGEVIATEHVRDGDVESAARVVLESLRRQEEQAA